MEASDETLSETDTSLMLKQERLSRSPALRSHAPKPHRGRPSSDAENGAERSQAILNAAISLFAQQGYQSTTMSQIADACGYKQSSLYYWYKSKEDILDAVIESTGSSLLIASRIAKLPDDKTTQLYAVLYCDTLMMCELPCDFYDLENVSRNRENALDGFFSTYQQLTDAVRQIIEEGMEQGEFIRVDPAYAAADALAVNEGLQHRFHNNRRFGENHTCMIEPSALPLFRTKESLARHAATLTLKYLAPNCIPAHVHQQARDNNWI